MTNFFGPNSPYLSHPLLTAERTSLEVDQLISWCETAPSNVVDFGCGFGRHCVEFARRDIAATGVDPSDALLAEARRRAEVNGVVVEFVQGTAETFTLEKDPKFDLGISMFTSFGQLDSPTSEARASESLTNMARLVRSGGTLVIEVPEKGRAAEALVSEEQLGETLVRRSFDANTSVLSEQFVTSTDTFDLAYQLFTEDELRAAVIAAGFRISAIYDEAVLTPPFTFMTLVAERL